MALTLNHLINKKIFKSYDVMSASQTLNKEIKSVSILETPDFERYIIKDSIILTTLYPIHNELELANKLLIALKDNNTAGIIIKVHRYVESLPETFLELAEELEIPIITLNYDANLSTLFNNILFEIQLSNLSNASLEKSYASILQKVYENPTTKELMTSIKIIEDIELLIENIDDKSVKYSSENVYKYYLKHKKNSALIQRIEDNTYYLNDVVYEEKPIYKMVFLARKDRRHIIYNTIEIFRLILIIIYQKKQEKIRKQNVFLMNFVSGGSKKYSNKDIALVVKEFQWNISFPIMLVIISTKKMEDLVSNTPFIEYSKSVIINKWHVKNNELRFAQIENLLVFIVNIRKSYNYNTNVLDLYNLLKKSFPQIQMNISYSNEIYEVSEISSKYHMMQNAASNIKFDELPKNIFNENDLELFNLLRTVDSSAIYDYINKVFLSLRNKPLIEQKTLKITLYTYIENQFNIKKTAEDLYVHYNTVRYRLDQLNNLGLLPSKNSNYFKTYFALYLFNHFEH